MNQELCNGESIWRGDKGKLNWVRNACQQLRRCILMLTQVITGHQIQAKCSPLAHRDRITAPAPVSFTYGVASLQLATSGAAALGVGGVVFLHREDGGCLGNRWRSLVEGRGGHQCRGETLTGNIHRLRLLLQSAEGQTRRGTCYCYIHMVYGWKGREWTEKRWVTFIVPRARGSKHI